MLIIVDEAAISHSFHTTVFKSTPISYMVCVHVFLWAGFRTYLVSEDTRKLVHY